MEEKPGFRYPSVTADSVYESEEGYRFLRENNQRPYKNLILMRNGKNAALKKTSPDGKTWHTMKKMMFIPVMPAEH